MSETYIPSKESISEIPDERLESDRQSLSFEMEAYLHVYKSWAAEQAAQVIDQLLTGIEIAPDAWDRPGAKALTAAAAEWVLQDPTQEEAIRGFIAELVKPEAHDEASLAMLERARQLRSETHVAAAKEWLSGNDPLLTAGRERLGITTETERPFEIVVVDDDSGMYDQDKTKQVHWSRVLTESDSVVMPPVFVYKITDLPPVMVLDRATVNILQDPTHHQYSDAVKAVLHEYGHTQRDIMTTDQIGVGLEERMAILVAGGQKAYIETMVYSHILNALSDQQFGQRFRDVIAGAANMDEVYEIVTAAAGPQAAMALAGIPAHAQHYELPEYTKVMIQDDETGPAAVYRHLTEFADMTKLVTGLSTLDGVIAKWVMNNAMASGITFQPEVATALIACLGPDDDPDYYRRHYGLAVA